MRYTQALRALDANSVCLGAQIKIPFAGILICALERDKDRTFEGENEEKTPLQKMLEMYQRLIDDSLG